MTNVRSQPFSTPGPETTAVLARLMEASFPGRNEVASQIAVARVRPCDDDGCLEFERPDAPPAPVVRRIPVEAEAEEADGTTFHVLLHVVDGFINELERFREDGHPIQGPIRPEALRLLEF